MLKWTKGFTRAELERAEECYNIRFPPDLFELLLDRNLVNGYDWRTDNAEIWKQLDWPREGLVFDVENNDLWLPSWGAKPETAEEREEIISSLIANAPKLVPIYSHRFIPSEPFERGNPVFSVYQSDIIYYGSDLQNYLSNEAGAWSFDTNSIRSIRFWSDFVH